MSMAMCKRCDLPIGIGCVCDSPDRKDLQLAEGWLQRQLEIVRSNVAEWPEHIRQAAGIATPSPAEQRRGQDASWLNEPFSDGESWLATMERAVSSAEGSYVRRRLMEKITPEKILHLARSAQPLQQKVVDNRCRIVTHTSEDALIDLVECGQQMPCPEHGPKLWDDKLMADAEYVREQALGPLPHADEDIAEWDGFIRGVQWAISHLRAFGTLRNHLSTGHAREDTHNG